MPEFKWPFSRVLVLAAGLAGLSCDESLPPRVDPDHVLSPSMEIVPGEVQITYNGDVDARGYSPGAFHLTLKNTGDEVYQDLKSVHAYVDIWLKGNPGARNHIEFGEQQLRYQNLTWGDSVTFKPGATIEWIVQWSHSTNAATPFFHFVGTVTSGKVTVTYQAETSIQLFKRLKPQSTGVQEFSITYAVVP